MKFVPAALRRRLDPRWSGSRERWRAARPTTNLTWDAEVTGDAFVERASAHGIFGPGKRILEVGPGYGRLLASAIGRVQFESWMGIDLSADNVQHLARRFEGPEIEFMVADAETVELDRPADGMISSLTFKHMFPSFEAPLANLARQLAPGAMVAFDLIEGHGNYFEEDEVTYIRWYERYEVEEILSRSGLALVALDEVRHLPELVRMLVVARKPA